MTSIKNRSPECFIIALCDCNQKAKSICIPAFVLEIIRQKNNSSHETSQTSARSNLWVLWIPTPCVIDVVRISYAPNSWRPDLIELMPTFSHGISGSWSFAMQRLNIEIADLMFQMGDARNTSQVEMLIICDLTILYIF